MKPKEIELLRKLLVKKKMPEPDANEVINELKEAAESEKDAKEEKPAKKTNTFACVISCPEGVALPKDLVGWVFKHPDDLSSLDITESIREAAIMHNNPGSGVRRRGKGKIKVETVGETLEIANTKKMKSRGYSLMTKMPVQCLVMPNKIDLDSPLTLAEGAVAGVQE